MINVWDDGQLKYPDSSNIQCRYNVCIYHSNILYPIKLYNYYQCIFKLLAVVQNSVVSSYIFYFVKDMLSVALYSFHPVFLFYSWPWNTDILGRRSSINGSMKKRGCAWATGGGWWWRFLSRELVCFLMLAYLAAIMTLTLACAVGWRGKVQRHYFAFMCHLLLPFDHTRF